MALHVVCIGEVMIELSGTAHESDAARLGVAGDTFNWAVYLRRALPPQHKVSYLTCLGADPFSARIKEAIARESVDTGHILTHPTRLPGLYAISLDAAGERSFHYWRGQSAARTLFDTSASTPSLEGVDVVALSGITLAILTDAARADLLVALGRLRADGGLVALDSNYRPALWSSAEEAAAVLDQFWEVTDIALPSLDDELALAPGSREADVIARFSARDLRAGALKRGDAGPLGLTSGAHHVPAAQVKVVDTTSAGDSFNGAFLAAILEGQSEAEALAAGHACAARVITYHGAIVPRAEWTV
ncbi:sugar kinase [Pseudaestuariivita sp.]|uniref:sugar kinase n=1 Tax=Pseudaestuariivita sp. TaxID=2211669 RepID=UPI004058C619